MIKSDNLSVRQCYLYLFVLPRFWTTQFQRYIIILFDLSITQLQTKALQIGETTKKWSNFAKEMLVNYIQSGQEDLSSITLAYKIICYSENIRQIVVRYYQPNVNSFWEIVDWNIFCLKLNLNMSSWQEITNIRPPTATW